MEVDPVAGLEEVKRRVAQAAASVGRDPSDVTIVAVSKGAPIEAVRHLWESGHRDLGENRAQELAARSQTLPDARWHFIGRLQTNKVKHLVGRVEMIHSVDRLELARQIAHRLPEAVEVLMEVNVSGEGTKAGVAMGDAEALVGDLLRVDHLRLTGLMTMAPVDTDPEASRPLFRRLAQLRDRLGSEFPQASIHHLSMGMSQDYVVAVQEGATVVRVGTAIFGPRRLG